jgi:hypothetical protein
MYDAAKTHFPAYHFNPIANSLTVRGLNLGKVMKRSGMLDCQVLKGQKTQEKISVIKQTLLALTDLITHHRRHFDTMDEVIAPTRACDNLNAQLSKLSSYVLSVIKNRKEDSYIALFTMWCNHCEKYISSWGGTAATSTPPSYHNCKICDYGNFDICTQCYDLGKRCYERSHSPTKETVPVLKIPHDEELIETLQANVGKAHPEDFPKLLQVGSTCKRVVFFETPSGWCGSASDKIETGDVVAVLFRSRMPFVLRRHGSGYRLVSPCYLQGFMDGEAIDPWKKGELKQEDFEII